MAGFVSKELVDKAKQVNVMDYIEQFEMDEWKRIGNSYKNLNVSGGLYLYYKNDCWHWKWHSGGSAGITALSYLTDIKKIDFIEAVETLSGGRATEFVSVKKTKLKPVNEQKNFVLPEKSPTQKHLFAYLTRRGISRSVIDYCINHKVLYEGQHTSKTTNKTSYNCVFVGYNMSNRQPTFASYKGCFVSAQGNKSYSGIATCSNKKDTFKLLPRQAQSKKIHLFEAAIDALSWMTLQESKGVSLDNMLVVSAEGINGEAVTNYGVRPDEASNLELISAKKSIENGSEIVFENTKNREQIIVKPEEISELLPGYLEPIVKENERFAVDNNYTFALHFDNDFAGVTASIKTKKALENLGYKVTYEPCERANCKDWNDALCSIKNIDWKQNTYQNNVENAKKPVQKSSNTRC